MGAGVVPVYETQISDEAQFNGDGKGLAEDFSILNELASAAGLRPLGDFAQNEFEEYVDGTSSLDLTYHPISEALATVVGLMEQIRSKPDAASKLSDPEYTFEELEELARSLRDVESSGTRFCLFFM